MGNQPGANRGEGSLDEWLRDGGLVIASSDRAARAIQADYHRLRRAEGLSAWPAPQVVDWNTLVRAAWEERNSEGLLLLNATQEQAVWSGIIESDHQLATTLPPSIRRLASMAMEAHDLLCSYAPRLLRDEARAGWDQDAGAFSQWLSAFDLHRLSNRLISASRVPLELIATLRKQNSPCVPLRLAGFDRLLPVQRELFDTWGSWQLFEPKPLTAKLHFHSIRDTQSELETCAHWCHHQLAANPGTRLLVITQDQSQRRGEIERAFLRFSPLSDKPSFEFSLGIPLTQIPFTRSALLILRWLQGTVDENDLDWLFASNFAGSPAESASLQACMRSLRGHDLQRPRWTLEAFLNAERISSALPREWTRRMIAAQRGLREAPHTQSPTDWADKVPHVLATASWAGSLPQTSADFQAQRRWSQALDTAGSLGFDGRRISWPEFLAELEQAAEETLFAPQSVDAPIQIAGPAESAGLTADAIWFLGADEDSWPSVASTNPFIPLYAQREFEMPHASPADDWQFAAAITARLLASAPEVHFSFAQQKDDVESAPSRLVKQIAGPPQPVPVDVVPPAHDAAIAETIADLSTVAFASRELHGGAAVLSSQSQCPFKAFATARLAADGWDAAESGLSAKQRGKLLHDVLRSIWSGKPTGIKTHAELIGIKNLPAFVRSHVKTALQSGIPSHVREQMPSLYIDLEETRLVRLITEWLEFERFRLPFTVENTEAKRFVTIEGITMNLRPDRVDRLHDGTHLVIDYKTGSVDPKSWDLPRPEDIQLPLYKLYGLEPLQPSLFDSVSGGPARGGLVFARVRTGQTCFAGRVADAQATIRPDLNGNNALAKRKLTAAEEFAWKNKIEKLTRDFVRGRAEVDPRDYPKTCEYCGFQSICRIQEPKNQARFEENETEEHDAGDE
jgi:ATP-dependent helicase/nuclease subunit B